jgi:hypothetical protein
VITAELEVMAQPDAPSGLVDLDAFVAGALKPAFLLPPYDELAAPLRTLLSHQSVRTG